VTTFPDVTKTWQLIPVGWMQAENLTTGTSPTTFSPDDPVTRGQFATFTWRWKDPPPVAIDETSPGCADATDGINGRWFRVNPFVSNEPMESLDCTTQRDAVWCEYSGYPIFELGNFFGWGDFTGTATGADSCPDYLADRCDAAVFIARGESVFAGSIPHDSFVTLAARSDSILDEGWDMPSDGGPDEFSRFYCPWFTSQAEALAAFETGRADCAGI
jgi:hypothetical protein